MIQYESLIALLNLGTTLRLKSVPNLVDSQTLSEQYLTNLVLILNAMKSLPRALEKFQPWIAYSLSLVEYSQESGVIDADWLIPLKDSAETIPFVTESYIVERLPNFLKYMTKLWHQVPFRSEDQNQKQPSLPPINYNPDVSTDHTFTLCTPADLLTQPIVPADVQSLIGSDPIDLALNASTFNHPTKDDISKKCFYIYRKKVRSSQMF